MINTIAANTFKVIILPCTNWLKIKIVFSDLDKLTLLGTDLGMNFSRDAEKKQHSNCPGSLSRIVGNRLRRKLTIKPTMKIQSLILQTCQRCSGPYPGRVRRVWMNPPFKAKVKR